jgi:hypothetical protein
MGAWDRVLNDIVLRSFAAARRGDRVAEVEAMRQFDLLVEFGGGTDLLANPKAAARNPQGQPKA